jgi:hypothetical protein
MCLSTTGIPQSSDTKQEPAAPFLLNRYGRGLTKQSLGVGNEFGN